MPYKIPEEMPLAQTVSLMITEDCNLRCKYCYEPNKTKRTMSFDTLKRVVDFVLDQPVTIDRVVWEFMGGEPLLEFDLIKQAVIYIESEMRRRDHPWRNSRLYATTTNGTMFTPEIKKQLEANRCIFSVGLSLDGIPYVHNMNRSSSYDRVMENFRWWRETFPWNTIKATVNKESLPYLADSVIHLVGLGLDKIYMNNVFEDVWDSNDVDIFREQLYKVADYLLEDGRYERVYVSYFPREYREDFREIEERNWCGCGTCMLSVDVDGNFYPCHRFQVLSLRSNLKVGDIDSGYDYNMLRPFTYCNMKNLQGEYREKCRSCRHRSLCSWCTAYNYDVTGSIFERAPMPCDMIEAQAEVNKYFFEQIARLEQGVDN